MSEKKQGRMHNMAKSIQLLQPMISYDFFIIYFGGVDLPTSPFKKKVGVSKVSLGVVKNRGLAGGTGPGKQNTILSTLNVEAPETNDDFENWVLTTPE